METSGQIILSQALNALRKQSVLNWIPPRSYAGTMHPTFLTNVPVQIDTSSEVGAVVTMIANSAVLLADVWKNAFSSGSSSTLHLLGIQMNKPAFALLMFSMGIPKTDYDWIWNGTAGLTSTDKFVLYTFYGTKDITTAQKLSKSWIHHNADIYPEYFDSTSVLSGNKVKPIDWYVDGQELLEHMRNLRIELFEKVESLFGQEIVVSDDGEVTFEDLENLPPLELDENDNIVLAPTSNLIMAKASLPIIFLILILILRKNGKP